MNKPGDPCVEGDSRPSLDGFWCGACHMAAQREQAAYLAERVGPPCNWMDRAIARFQEGLAHGR